MNMPCENARPLIPSYLDGEVGEEIAAPLRQHLLACPACRETAKQETGLKRWFAAPSVPAVPSDFASRVAAAAFAGVHPGQTERESTLVPFQSGLSSSNAFASGSGATLAAVTPEESTRGFVIQLTSFAAAALLLFSLAIRYRSLPTSSELDASPVTTVEEILREEREAEEARQAQAASGDASSVGNADSEGALVSND